MTALGTDDFVRFFTAVHGNEPFPWQLRLARQVLETGKWPALLDLPTGAGKTAAIDVAVFHLACEADRGPLRRAPLRILFVIDRRIVVDAAFERSKTIVQALRAPKDDVVVQVAQRLSKLSGDRRHPLDAVRLRGGVPQERDWARSPAQPLVAVSTVDQVGSRLLFRGYGVSPKMWPVHAGLVGADALWLLDEMHLSQPLEQTLDAIAAGHAAPKGLLAERPRLAPFAVVKMSATPGETAADAFRLDDADRDHSKLKPRLSARKSATLAQIDDHAAEAFVGHALRLAGLADEAVPKKKGRTVTTEAKSAHRVGVIVNRVNLAREIFDRLRSEQAGRADVLLLTGRIRPLDRDRLFEEREFTTLFANSNRPTPGRPVILVATQTVEAGADLDFDAMVTEIAPLDSLRQRFGRLDRLGQRQESEALIVYPKGSARTGEWASIARIYGGAASATRSWLEEIQKRDKSIDFGIDAFERRLEELASSREEEGASRLAALLPERKNAPVLLPAYADLWATTSPAPVATPEPALFLHGPAVATDVQIVWRADIGLDAVGRANRSLELCPPSALEACPVPLWTARRWLCRESGPMDAPADVPEALPEQRREQPPGRPCLRFDPQQGEWVQVSAEGLRPGDTIVVPAIYGGCDRWGWTGRTGGQVSDRGTEAHYRQRGKGALRVTRDLLADALRAEMALDEADAAALKDAEIAAKEIWRRIEAFMADAEDDLDGEAARAMLLAEAALPEMWRTLLENMDKRSPQVAFYDEDERSLGFILFARKQLKPGLLGHSEEAEDGDEAVTDREDSSRVGVEVKLSDHLGRVEAAARTFARRAGLDEPTISLVALAARLHDLGKAEPRFQAELHGVGALARHDPALTAILLQRNDGLLAKSKGTGRLRRSVRAVPENFRHEALSVALAARHPEVTRLDDDARDLVLWLIGTHHGYGRPFFPPCLDPQPATESEVADAGAVLRACAADAPLRLDQGWFERAARLHRRYGPWELARLEAVLRLADHAASAEEQEKGDADQQRSATSETAP